MDQDDRRPLSGGQKPEQNPLPVTMNLDAHSCATSSPGICSGAPHLGIRVAEDGLSSSSPKHSIPASPDRVRGRKEESTSRVIGRIVEVRRDLFGDEGIPAIAEALHLPHRTWMNYEKGVVMPAPVLLCFLDLTSVEPRWLLTGRGPKYQSRSTSST